MSARVGVYVRISDDTTGTGLGVARQEEDGRTIARLRGWDVADVYADNDISAFKRGVVRPSFERLLDDLASGVIDGIVAYDLDRFARQPADLERAIAIYDTRPGRVFATVQGDVDLQSADGRTMARVMVAFANKSSMDTARRVKRKHLELAQRGVPVGGNRPFGWQADKVTIDPAEAGLIRKAVDDVLLGVGLHTVCRHWNAAGVRTPFGNAWQRAPLRNMLLSPRLAGYRVYQGAMATDPAGNPVIGQQEAILPVEVWQAVVDRITNRGNGAYNHGKRKYLLSGLVRCGVCNGLMRGNANTADRTFTYGCPPPTSSRGSCGRNAISGPQTDAFVTDIVHTALAHRELTHDETVWAGETRLRDLESRATELFAAFSSGRLSGERAFPVIENLESEIRDLRAERERVMKENVEAAHRPASVAAQWDDLETEQMREIVASLLSAVVIQPAAKKGGRFDHARIATYPR